MRRKVILLAIGVTGLLVVLALLAFAYTPHIAPTVAPVNVLAQPAQMDNNTSTGDATLINNSINVDSVESAPRHIGRSCETDSASNPGY